MSAFFKFLPAIVIACAGLAMHVHGPIHQPASYHQFADHSLWFGIAHAGDVLSNIGFAAIAVWGAIRLRALTTQSASGEQRGFFGYGLFLLALLLTAAGSTYYHLAPDDWRLVWDRLPIALACAGLLAGIRARLVPDTWEYTTAITLAALAVVSVAWWYVGQLTASAGDLRLYLLLQAAPLVLIPLWQAIYGAERRERLYVGVAIALYVLAKIAELHDHDIHNSLGWLSGHTIKHLLATAAAWALVSGLIAKPLSPHAVTRTKYRSQTSVRAPL